MDLVSIFLIIIVAIAFGIVSYYFISDYLDYKSEAAKKLDTERQDRLGNVRYVVDSVNNVNTDIFNTFNSNVVRQNEKVASATSMTSNLSAGLDSLFKLGASSASGATYIPFSSLPGTVPVTDLQLIKHVTAISGMTLKDLSSNNQFTMCGTGANPRCIQFPDTNGNTILTNLHSNKDIVLDGPTKMYNPLTMSNGANGAVSTLGVDSEGTLNITANRLAIRNENQTQTGQQMPIDASVIPQTYEPAQFQLETSYNTMNNIFKVGVAGNAGTSTVLTAQGDIIIGGKHVISTNGGTENLIIYPNAQRSQGNDMGTLYIAGNVRIAGSFTSNLGKQLIE